ncbi:hypothetical protein [Erythrobacter sp. F6033]|uniref:hypothetical protein n=1 Tax=Erythrobacter sp. F6033 TaxID=2926401 RepID=UPI001FF68617|nr:hypothetical protein [Erythrobacter sp. F6033]MCK0128031.1 hypothetical protein [Erythrobacter sp. F6033]
MKPTAAIAGFAAAAAMSATPASAAELPAAPAPSATSVIFTDFAQSRFDEGDVLAEHHRRWGRHRYRRNRVSAGDVLTGVLIIGGIAAIANASNKKDRTYREPDYRRTRDYDRDQDRRDTRRSNAGSGLESAVDQCVTRIERDVRVDSVDNVDRTAEGWTVTGALFNGNGFACQIGNDGRISDVNYGGFQASGYDAANTTRARGDDRQWSDDRYTAARAKVQGQQRADATPEQLPAYPGGPVPGDEYPGDVDADLGG